MRDDLVERLEALVARTGESTGSVGNGAVIALDCADFIRDHGAEIAAALRAVREAPVVDLTWGDFNRGLAIEEQEGKDMFAWERELTGTRVRIVPVEDGDD